MTEYYTQSSEDVIKELGAEPKKGLTGAEVEKRTAKYGPNRLPEEKPPSGWVIFFRQLNNVFTYILFAAAVITLFLHEYIDTGIIIVAMFANVIVGYIQESKAQKTISQLRKVVVVKSKVIRNGKVKLIDSAMLLPGDVILLDAGDRVPADSRIISSLRFSTQEQALTGESAPINKDSDVISKKGTALGDRKNMVYMGTVVVLGKAKAVVVATGVKTEIGKITRMVKEVKEEPTPLQKRLRQLSIWIGSFAVVACVALVIIGVLKGKDLGEMLVFAAAIAVSAVPEGLVVISTVILAIGMKRILKRKALVRELLSAETLGSTNVICSDKTGTITTGKMRVEKVDLATGEFNIGDIVPGKVTVDLSKALLIGALCNDLHIENPGDRPKQWKIIGDTTEKALLMASIKAGQNKEELAKKYPEIDEIPFDSYIKYMATAHYNADRQAVEVMVKGTTERMLEFSKYIYRHGKVEPLTEADRRKFIKINQKLSQQGYRVISVAFRDIMMTPKEAKNFKFNDEKFRDYVFAGTISIRDPIREGIRDSIKLCQQAGIKIKMITGDHKLTAKSIANDIGLDIKSDDELIDGEEFESLSEQELLGRISKIKVFARVAPKHKVQIVDTLQKCGEVVAMTGDGVNDSPALKEADIGIAMGSGTEAAKETSNMILLNDDFKTIVAAVEEGRLIFDNIRKVVLYFLSDGFAEIIIIVGAILMGWPLPLLPAQILWINLIDDGFPAMSLAFDKKEREIMKEPPRKKTEAILDSERRILIFFIGAISGFGVLLIFYFMWKYTGDVTLARTVAFTTLALDSLVYVFSIRSLRHSIFHERFFSNKILLIAVASGLIAQIVAIYVPIFQTIFRTTALGLFEWGVVLCEVVLVITIIEVVKWFFNRLKKKEA